MSESDQTRFENSALLVTLTVGQLRELVHAELEVATSRNGKTAPLLTVEELHQALKVPKSWIYERTRRKTNSIPHLKVGRYPRFDLTEVKAWLKDQKEIC
jgi:excisionase family DNA binding protein